MALGMSENINDKSGATHPRLMALVALRELGNLGPSYALLTAETIYCAIEGCGRANCRRIVRRIQDSIGGGQKGTRYKLARRSLENTPTAT